MSDRISSSSLPCSEATWSLLLALGARRRAGTLPEGPSGLWRGSRSAGTRDARWRADEGARPALVDGAADDARALVVRDASGSFTAGPASDEIDRAALELYLPLLGARAGRPFTVAHLGQSVDGCVATATGDSRTVTGEEDFVHMHRLRALCDAVLVGAGTVAADDPRLTTRLVEGPSPARVVVDPRGRLDPTLGLFGDGAAPTLWVCRASGAEGASATASGLRPHVERLEIAAASDGAFLPSLRDELVARGLHALLVEGGGVTVTRWLEAGLVDRLQLAVAPVVIGRGRAGLQLPSASSMDTALRPPCRLYRLGDDVLWDFDLRGP